MSLTKVKSARKDQKRDLVQSVQECVDKYTYAYVFSFENMRSGKFKDVRHEWADSRFFLGKNKVMGRALGSSADDEYRPALSQLSADLTGNVGLLFTDRAPAEVRGREGRNGGGGRLP